MRKYHVPFWRAAEEVTSLPTFLANSRTQMAGNLIETQHRHNIAALTTNLDLDDLDSFECDLTPEVARLADESGTITIDLNNATEIGF